MLLAMMGRRRRVDLEGAGLGLEAAEAVIVEVVAEEEALAQAASPVQVARVDHPVAVQVARTGHRAPPARMEALA